MERRGWLQLRAVPRPASADNLWLVPNLILQKFPAPQFSVTTRVDLRGLAVGIITGLVVMGLDYSSLAVDRTAHGFRMLTLECQDAQKGSKEVEESLAEFSATRVFLRVTVTSGAICNFSFSTDGRQFTPAGKPFTARAGLWIGAKVGLFCLAENDSAERGYSDFDWFRVERIATVR